jgi:uncharacterized protein YjlB
MRPEQPAETLLLPPDEMMPNSPLPVVIYRDVTADGGATRALDALFEANGWRGTWRNGVYDFDHFHSNAHEVLGVGRGSATLQLGGDAGQAVAVEAGDVLVLPAGTGHRRITASADFTMIGAYPPGQEHYDICRARGPEIELRISKLGRPTTDPVYGSDGPLLSLWS